MTDDPDPDLAALAAEFPGWKVERWKNSIRARRRPVTAYSEWVVRAEPEEVRAEIRNRKQNPPGG